MNQKIVKKIRKVNRQYNEDFAQKILRPKPKWIPWRLWLWALGKFIHIEDIEK